MGPKKVLSSFEPKKKVSSFSNYLNVLSRSLSRRKKSSPSLSLSLSFVFETRAHLRRKKSQNNKTLRVFLVFLFFFSEEEDSLWAKEDRPRFESEEKERSEMYTIDFEREFFFCLSRESSCTPKENF